MTLLSQQERRVWTRQPQVIAAAASGWQRVYNFSTKGASSLNGPASYGSLTASPGSAGIGVLVNAASQLTMGEIVPGISAGITFVLIAERFGTSNAGDFLLAEQAISVGGNYNYGFYESLTSSDSIYFFINNGSTGVYAPGVGLWTAGNPAVWVGTFGDGDQNVRLYKNGVLVGSAAQSGSIMRDPAAVLRDGFWNASGSHNHKNYAAGISNRRMSDAEVAAKFSTVPNAYAALFKPRRTRRYISLGAGGTNYTATLTATTTSAASILKAAKAQRQASTTAAAAIAKAAVSSKAAAVTSSATLARSAKLTRSATAVASAAVSKLAAAMRSATTTGSATLGTIKAKLLTLTASVTNSATVRRAIGATRVATTTAAGTLARAISTTKAALTTASGTIGKVVATTKAAATASMATVATVKAKLLTLAASLSVSGAITKTIKITRSGAVSLLALLERLFISGGGGPAEIFAALTSKRSERNSEAQRRPKQ